MQRACLRAVCYASRSPSLFSTRRNLPSSKALSTGRRAFHATGIFTQDVVPLRKALKDDARLARSAKKQNGTQQSRSSEVVEGWQLTVGIEIHAQLNTARKLFSSASTSPTSIPNSHLEPFDLALPGSQPMFQYATLIPALRVALALNCDVQPTSTFDRKHYFYHDQPAGYQITQYYNPFAINGSVVLEQSDGLDKGERLEIGIKQIQMEQDTARTRDLDAETSLVDFNRAGHPLLEIISLPHIHTPRAAGAYVRKVQGILHSMDALFAGLESGGMRADVNVSVRRMDSEEEGHSYAGVHGLGQRTEIKNLNAIKGVEDAVRAERDRQIALLESGGVVEGETRAWSVTSPHTTTSLRSKEGEVDYRYMPDPDIPPLHIAEDLVQHLYETLPMSPEDTVKVLQTKYGLSQVDAAALISLDDQQRLDYFLDVLEDLSRIRREHGKSVNTIEDGKTVGNWVLHEIGSLMSSTEQAWSSNLIPHDQLGKLIDLQHRNIITSVSAKQVLRMLFEGDKRQVKDIVEAEGLTFTPMSAAKYQQLATSVIEEFPDHVRDIRESGKIGKIKFLLGQMMRQAEKGKIEATVAEEVLRLQLGV